MSQLVPVKILIAGGFAVGKTTFVASISDIEPLTTEAAMTVLSNEIDNIGAQKTKTETTVAMDFGRVQLDESMTLYLFGTPGQSRFEFMWDELGRGAIGAVVMVDTRRLAENFAAVDFMERSKLPFVVAINAFDGDLYHHPDSVREALALNADVPLLVLDARDRGSVRAALIALVRHARSKSWPTTTSTSN